MAGRGGEMAAGGGGRGHLRASHADREQVIGILKAAFVQGMLGRDEFGLRVGQALASRTGAELAAVTAGLPAGLTAARPPQPAGAQGKARVLRSAAVLTAATGLYAAMWPLALSIHKNMEGNPVTYAHKLVVMSTVAYVLVAVMAVMRMRNSRQDKRSGGQRPERPVPGAGGQASRRLPSAGAGGELPPPGHGHTAEAAPRRRLPRSPSPGRGHCAGDALAAGTALAS